MCEYTAIPKILQRTGVSQLTPICNRCGNGLAFLTQNKCVKDAEPDDHDCKSGSARCTVFLHYKKNHNRFASSQYTSISAKVISGRVLPNSFALDSK